MRKKLISLFNFPEKTLVNKKIPKNSFYRQDTFDRKDVELFTACVEGIYVLGIFNPSSANIPVYITEDINYAEVTWLYVELRDKGVYKKIADIIHRMIPNPIVLLLHIDDQILISTGRKRLHKTDKDRQVIESIAFSPWMQMDNLNEQEERFFLSTRIENLSFTNLHMFYEQIGIRVEFTQLIPLIGLYPSASAYVDGMKQIMSEFESIADEVERLHKEHEQELHFGRKMELYMKLQRKEQELVSCKEKLKGLC